MTPLVPFSERVRHCAQRLVESREAAIAGLYDLTACRLLRFAVTITRNQHDAEDALQAALLRVAGEGERLLRADEPWAYLLKMVRNESLLVLRRKKRLPILSDISDLVTRSRVDELHVQESHRQIWVALRSLPTDQSEVVVLKIWEEMTFVQIAEMLEISPATAASRYRYALQKLESKFRSSNMEVLP